MSREENHFGLEHIFVLRNTCQASFELFSKKITERTVIKRHDQEPLRNEDAYSEFRTATGERRAVHALSHPFMDGIRRGLSDQ